MSENNASNSESEKKESDFSKKDYVALAVLFIIALWLWTIPIRASPMPFGEHDGAYIFSYGDYMTQLGRTSNLVGDHPISNMFWYPAWNPVLGPSGQKYPPAYTVDYTLAQTFGGDRIVSAYIFIALSCMITFFGIYILMRKLYGFEAAVLSSIASIFSFREIMLYLWGQRHNIMGFALIPITIYFLYRYLETCYDEKENVVYLYLFAALMLGTYLIHLSATVYMATFTIIFFALAWIQNRKLPINFENIKKNWHHYAIIFVGMLIAIVPFYLIYFGPQSVDAKPGIYDLSGLFQWLKIPTNTFSMNPAFSDFNTTYPGKIVLVFVFASLAYLIWRRALKDLAIISAIVALYVMFHLSTFGMIAPDNYRVGRYLIIESQLFYCLIAIALVTIPRLFKIEKTQRAILKYVLVGGFLIFLVAVQGKQAYSTLKESYPPILRLTPAQYEASQWVYQNVPETDTAHLIGTLTYPKKAFFQILSGRLMYKTGDWLDDKVTLREYRFKDALEENTPMYPIYFKQGKDLVSPINYIIFDYSDLAMLNDVQKAQYLFSLEMSIQNITTVVYNKNNIHILKYN